MSKAMSEPIDFIDLTVESAEKYLNRNRNRNGNAENISNNIARTKPKKRTSSKQQQTTQLSDSIIEIAVESARRDAKSSEVIDIDNNSARNSGTCCINESTAGNLHVLTCPICYEELSSKLKPMSTRCGHIFCSHCLEQIMRTSRKCPTCQRAIKHRACTRLYF
ncbi:uncharacterized protein LOC143376721 [Andrena cerasifolii]|uniref:uncharacterized protein LOC143376721 n=1 Tax=Andrena cerasifolii TaxID=2819439 RepID=UPI0040380DD3